MSKAGDRFDNPVTRETGYVRLGTEETRGASLVVDLRMPPSAGPLLPMHLHPGHTETFTVVEGDIEYVQGDQSGVVHAGEHGEIPPGVAHGWWNVGGRDARVIVEVSPAGRFEELTRTVFGLVHEGKTNPQGIPGPLQAAVLAKEFGDVIVFSSPPRWIQRILYGVLAPIGRLLGYRATYPRHAQIRVDSVELEPLPDGIIVPGVGPPG